MKKLATTAAAVARRSCARINHIRGVKLEKRIIVPILPPKWGAERPSIPTFGRARYLAQSWPGSTPPINRRILEP
jgi:hypothetical protein